MVFGAIGSYWVTSAPLVRVGSIGPGAHWGGQGQRRGERNRLLRDARRRLWRGEGDAPLQSQRLPSGALVIDLDLLAEDAHRPFRAIRQSLCRQIVFLQVSRVRGT